MIIYSKTLWGFPLLTRVYGSALPRSLLPALLSGLITLLLLLLREQMQHLWVHPYPYQPLVLIATFVLTFRSNYAYQRHWEAYTQMQTMTARWLDATVQAIMFDRHPQPPGGKLPSPASHHQFVAELVHLVSLLHATCCAALRRDPDVANLVKHSRLAEAPPTDPAQLLNLQRGSLQGGSAPNSPRGGGGGGSGLGSAAGRRASADEPRLSRRRSGESSGGAFGSAAAAAAAAGSPRLSGYFDIAALSSRLQSARSFGRSPSAPSLAGMAGSNPLIRSPSINLKLNVAPPTPRRIKVSLNHTCCWAHLPYMDRPLLLLSWVHELMLQRQTAGGLRMPAPILARVYTGLSDGLTAYEQCRKLADTPFPFPWAQFVLVMLVLFTNSSMAVVITVMTTAIFWTVNEVARDVEDAFIMEPNNMPLANTQFHFNELLLTLTAITAGHGVSTGGVSTADGQYSLISGQHNAGQQQYNVTWEDDVSSTARDSCSMAADAAELETTGTAAARAVLVASAASNIQSMEAFAGGSASPAAAGGASPVATGGASPVPAEAAAGHGVFGWEMQPVASSSDDMV
ncbi:hypothetical protein OEZ86_008645 [Tetradesmus obliquus]|nr:hypothetical protein OEZ86_008645 [Tetradesmus obliquus]